MPATISMRLLIGILVAVVILVVASVTLTITYHVSLTSLKDIGERFAATLGETASVKTKAYFDYAVDDIVTWQNMARAPGLTMPLDDDLTTWQDKYMAILLRMQLRGNSRYVIMGALWDEGSAINTNFLENGEFRMWASNIQTVNTSGFSHEYIRDTNLRTMVARQSPRPADFAPRKSAKIPLYDTARSLFAGSNGFWLPLQVVVPYYDPIIVLPVGGWFYNGSGHFMGAISLAIETTRIDAFLAETTSLPDIEAFAIDGRGKLLGSTHDAPYINSYWSTSPTPPTGCASSSVGAIQATNYSITCFADAATYAYAPLARFASEHSDFVTRPNSVNEVKASGETYVVASTQVQNNFTGFRLVVVFIFSEQIILSNVVSSRNLSIGITAAIFVVATGAAFGLVMLLLKPLHQVSRRMHDTARLRDVPTHDTSSSDGPEYSALTEVRDLQKSYYNMNSAIQSFTKYVPRDVVSDLLQSGQLCEIKMENFTCSTLFTDIQGFTTICERVPTEQLSFLVSQYFDVMSDIVMSHDGLIDKYIGDCIMAVWGAPFPLPNQEIKCTLAGVLLNRETLVDPICGAFDEAGEILGIRVGINTGMVLAGNMGSSQRMNYTVIGDAVNLAARLESMNKQFGTRVMVSQDTQVNLGSVFVLRLLMSIAVVGKKEPVHVYDVVGLGSAIPEQERRRLKELEDTFSRKFNSQSGSDSYSAMSADSKVSQAQFTYTKRRRDVLTLIETALALTAATEVPVQASEVDVSFAHAYSLAVQAFQDQQPDDALAQIKALASQFAPEFIGAPILHRLGLKQSESSSEDGSRGRKANNRPGALRRNVFPEKSFEILIDLCEEAILDPKAFTGVFTATEK